MRCAGRSRRGGRLRTPPRGYCGKFFPSSSSLTRLSRFFLLSGSGASAAASFAYSSAFFRFPVVRVSAHQADVHGPLAGEALRVREEDLVRLGVLLLRLKLPAEAVNGDRRGVRARERLLERLRGVGVLAVRDLGPPEGRQRGEVLRAADVRRHRLLGPLQRLGEVHLVLDDTSRPPAAGTATRNRRPRGAGSGGPPPRAPWRSGR